MRKRLLPVLMLVIALGAAGYASAQQSQPLTHPGPSPKGLVNEGAQLYAANCSSCHGIDGGGITKPRPGVGNIKGRGPGLIGVGARAADFYLRTGYMPLKHAGDQPQRSRPMFSDKEIRAMVAYVVSLSPGPPIPQPHPEQGSLPEGKKLFIEHCAGCHQAVAEGGYVTDARVPPLKDATPTQVAQAVRIGPFYMPRFSQKDLSSAQLNSIIRYVEKSKQPEDRGGWGIGHIGPVPEGIVAWFVAAAALVALCVMLGKRVSE